MEIIKASYYVYAKYHKTYSTPERITDCYEFEYCTAGEGYTVIDGKKYERKKGALVLAKPNQKRYAIGSFECYYIHFNLDSADTLKSKIDRLPDWYFPKESKIIEDIFVSVSDKKFTSESNEDMYIKGSVMQLTAILLETIYPFGTPAVRKYDRYFEEIIEAKTYMDLNYASKLDLKTVAAPANLSPNFFRIVFKDTVGVSPHEYLTEIRVKKAQEYLMNTDFSITRIAEACGFETQSYMNNVFKAHTGITPYKYRKIYRKEM
ncbi:MAG: helix-turn-helix domain-containing protein [Clostridiales bacterium]|nr:helix-turn-helix domain-containing protein [Candidatus Equinaster intestinalis]